MGRLALRDDAAEAGIDARPPVVRIDGVEDDQARVIDDAVGIFEAGNVFRLQRRAERARAEIDRAGRGQQAASAEVIVDEEPEAKHPARAQTLVMRQNETLRPDDMRRRAEQHLALLQRLVHQPERIALEIAQPAVDQLGRSGRGGAAEIGLLAEEDGQATSSGIAARCRIR